jgi:hypothetical protein
MADNSLTIDRNRFLALVLKSPTQMGWLSIINSVTNISRLGTFKGIVQPFELGGVTSLIRSAVRFCKAGHFQKKILMIQSHERSLKQNSAA